jgi:predicted transposase/invertase (TIGR01784 family)
VRRFYLNELGDPNQQPIGVSLLQLTIAPESRMAEQAKQVIQRAESEDLSILARKDIIELVITIAVYKFANLSRAEVEAMLDVTLQDTRVYREAKEEGLQEGLQEGRQEGREEMFTEMAPLLLERGMTIEEIAARFDLEVDFVRRVFQQGS